MLINKCDTKMSVKWLIIVVLMNGARCLADGESTREQIPLVRLPSNTLLKYTAYKDVSILHFDVPADTRTAYFNFKAYEESKSAFRKYPSAISHTIQTLIFICTHIRCLYCLNSIFILTLIQFFIFIRIHLVACPPAHSSYNSTSM